MAKNVFLQTRKNRTPKFSEKPLKPRLAWGAKKKERVLVGRENANRNKILSSQKRGKAGKSFKKTNLKKKKGNEVLEKQWSYDEMPRKVSPTGGGVAVRTGSYGHWQTKKETGKGTNYYPLGEEPTRKEETITHPP